jgi:hypothetical protein
MAGELMETDILVCLIAISLISIIGVVYAAPGPHYQPPDWQGENPGISMRQPLMHWNETRMIETGKPMKNTSDAHNKFGSAIAKRPVIPCTLKEKNICGPKGAGSVNCPRALNRIGRRLPGAKIAVTPAGIRLVNPQAHQALKN